jgi:hypothetical protein
VLCLGVCLVCVVCLVCLVSLVSLGLRMGFDIYCRNIIYIFLLLFLLLFLLFLLFLGVFCCFLGKCVLLV